MELDLFGSGPRSPTGSLDDGIGNIDPAPELAPFTGSRVDGTENREVGSLEELDRT